jgi:small subunit ribosomal protein S1
MEEVQRPGQPGQPGRPGGAQTGRDQREPGAEDEPVSMRELLEAEAGAVRDVRRGSVVEGTVVRIDPDEVLVDIGLKSEGVIPGREVTSIEEELGRPPRIGDTLLVYVVAPETAEGHALLSYRRAGTERFWRRAQEQVQSGEVVEARVLEVNRGGVVVDFGTRAFVPISQLVSVQRVGDTEEEQEQVTQQLRSLIGQTLKLKVIEADRRRNRLILSERQATRELRSQRRDTLLQQLEPGQIRRGRVSNIASFGAFVDLGGADGLVHISELSWSRVKHPSEVVKPGQEVEVYVIQVDRETKKIALSLRRAQEDPWLTIQDRYPLGSVVMGEVIKQAQFGVFIRVEDGVEGLVHNSEIAPQDRRLLQEGRTLPFRVISVDLDRRRLRLSPAPDVVAQGEAAPPAGGAAPGESAGHAAGPDAGAAPLALSNGQPRGQPHAGSAPHEPHEPPPAPDSATEPTAAPS